MQQKIRVMQILSRAIMIHHFFSFANHIFTPRSPDKSYFSLRKQGRDAGKIHMRKGNAREKANTIHTKKYPADEESSYGRRDAPCIFTARSARRNIPSAR
jgi:hypothetical protein